MKTIAILSSKVLANMLNAIDIENIIATGIEKDEIYFYIGSYENIKILPVVTGQVDFHLANDDLRWDWIKQLVNLMDEQPICLTFTPSSVNLTTQY